MSWTRHDIDTDCPDCGTPLTLSVSSGVMGYGSSEPRRKLYHLNCKTTGCIDQTLSAKDARELGY